MTKYFIVFSLIALCMLIPNIAYAQCCVGCLDSDCNQAAQTIDDAHSNYRPDIKQDISDEFQTHKNWVVDTFLDDRIANALQNMTLQLSGTGWRSIFGIGKMFDAKHQLETQRLQQELHFQATKSYQPSETMCTFGTTVRSMAHIEQGGKTTALAFSQRQMARHLGTQGIGGAKDSTDDRINRWNNFIAHYCEPRNNGWTAPNILSGLSAVCGENGGGNTDRINIDIDYTRAVENKRTFDIHGGSWVGSGEEIDILALSNNLYGHNMISRNIGGKDLDSSYANFRYLKLRAMAAKRNVAENSFNNIIGMKSLGASANNNLHIGRLLQDLGIPEDEVIHYIGLDRHQNAVYPSYYAILEILAKKIYQNPNFFAQLYDTPANTKRKSAALKAIELMLDRAIHESQLRQEMTTSVLLSTRLEDLTEAAHKEFRSE